MLNPEHNRHTLPVAWRRKTVQINISLIDENYYTRQRQRHFTGYSASNPQAAISYFTNTIQQPWLPGYVANECSIYLLPTIQSNTHTVKSSAAEGGETLLGLKCDRGEY